MIALEKKGFIKKDETPRGIKLLESVREKLHSSSIQLPVLGSIPAGGPVLTEEYIDHRITVDESMIKNPKDSFVLKVTGESMIDAGIYEGDLLVADAKKEPRVNDIVIALVDNGNTVKRLVKDNGKFFLKAENKDYNDIYPVNELEIQGVVIHLLRAYK